MKKLLIPLAVLLCLALVGGLVYVLAFMSPEETPAPPPDSSSVSQNNVPDVGVYSNPDVRTDADLLESLDRAINRNRDTVGWLKVPNTEINNCVLQSHDNETYLRTDENREYDIYGCYFVDYECNISTRADLSGNTIIYGHSDMRDNPDGKRFSQLFHYADPTFAAANPVITFSTMESAMQWQVFAVFYTDRSFNYIDANPPAGVDGLAAEVMKKSLYDFGVTIGPDDHILTLSTCTAKYGANDTEHRFVVMARLLEEDAEIPTSVELVELNPPE